MPPLGIRDSNVFAFDCGSCTYTQQCRSSKKSGRHDRPGNNRNQNRALVVEAITDRCGKRLLASLTLASRNSVNRCRLDLRWTASTISPDSIRVMLSLRLLHPPTRIVHQMDAVISWIQNPMEDDRTRLAEALRAGDP